MKIYSVTDERFGKYGKVVEGIDFSGLVKAMEETPCPDDVVYVPGDEKLEESTVYTLQYIAASPVEKLYTFTVTEAVLEQLQDVAARYMQHFIGRNFKSLEVLQTLC